MNPNNETLLARLPASSRTAAIRVSVAASLDVADRLAARRSEMSASGKYTEAGVNAALRDLLPASVRTLQIARGPIAALKREIEAKRGSLRPTDPDPANLFGAIQHMEIHQHLRSLNPLERDALLMTTNDIRLIEAAVTAPPELSGFGANDRETIEKIEARYSELKFPAETADLAALESLAAEADAIATVARNSLRDATMLEARHFEEVARKIEGAVWIVGEPGREQVCNVGPDGAAIYRAASPDEVAVGVRYASLEAYRAARVA